MELLFTGAPLRHAFLAKATAVMLLISVGLSLACVFKVRTRFLSRATRKKSKLHSAENKALGERVVGRHTLYQNFILGSWPVVCPTCARIGRSCVTAREKLD